MEMEVIGKSWMFQVLIALAGFAAGSRESANKCSKAHHFLPCGYDAKTRPNALEGTSTEVTLQIYIESFGEVDVEKMEFDAFGYLSQTWQDKRLNGINETPIILQGSHLTSLWTPDIYCINCRSDNLENGLNVKQGMIRIDQNGSVYMSSGITLTGSCYMNLRNFPFDEQRCKIMLSSYAYNLSDIVYKWKTTPYVKIKKMDQFMVDPTGTDLLTQQYMSGKFVIAVASFSFKRRFGYYLLQLYVPTAMLVALSWTMFCLNHEHTGDRIAIGVTLFLTMIFLNGYANSSLPKVSYVKLVDLFMVVSLGEILLITIESIIIARLFTMTNKSDGQIKQGSGERAEKKSRQKRVSGCLPPMCSAEPPDDQAELQTLTVQKGPCASGPEPPIRENEMNHNHEEMKAAKCKKSAWCKLHLCDMVEKTTMVLLPLSFIVFNIWYWTVLFAASE